MKGLVLAALLLIGSLAQSSAQFGGLMRSYVPGVASGGTPAIDGTPATTGLQTASQPITATMTTTQSNDVIIVVVGGTNIGASGTGLAVSGCGLTWTRWEYAYDTVSREVDLWYAVAASPLSACVITAAGNGSWTYSGMTAMGISGANTTTPFDPNGSSSGVAHGATSNPTVSGISTSNAHDILIGGVASAGSPTPTAGSGFTLVWNSGAVMPVLASEYEVVSATQSGISLTFGGLSGSSLWAMLAAAVQ